MSKETSAEVAHLAAQIAPMDKVDMLGALQFGHRLTKADGTKVDFDVAVRSIAASALTQTAEGELRISLPTRHIASAAEETIAATSEGADGRSFAIAIKMVMEVIDGLGAETLRITQTETGRNVRIDPIGGDGRFGCLAPVRA